MWQKQESKLELAASMVRKVMPQLWQKRNVIILCDSWYVKKGLVSIVDEYENLGLIGNAGLILSCMACGQCPPGSDKHIWHKGSPGLCDKQQ